MARSCDEYADDRLSGLTEEGRVAVALFSHVEQTAPVERPPDGPVPAVDPFQLPDLPAR